MRINEDSWLLNVPIAHRGLWGHGVPENSLPAFIAAANAGFAIETDLYCTKDGEIVCFHDDSLSRMTGELGGICDKTLSELKGLRLQGSDETIPTLKEVLSAIDGKTPILIEFKNQKDKTYVKKAVDILKEYKGEFAVQSFNPFILNKIKTLAPEFIRGILAAKKPDTKNSVEKFVVKHMPFNFLCKPDFISYDYKGLPLKKRKLKNRALLCWTITDEKCFEFANTLCDNIIFEGFIPEKK
ncbi:MAG: glycerophosphodiester phosphodiesterase family protein [Clostridia bacterium]|nr:glycerophosphodiester phosphodiesterase family protein [Clostridia bacterium]